MVKTQLTHREDEVLHLAISGLSNDEIAARLAISRRTVEAHMRTLFRKTGVSRRAQLAALYQGGDTVIAEPAAPGSLGAANGALSQQRRDLADSERQLEVYASAIRGLVDRQFPLFEERVEITVTIGEQDGQDTIVERRWTRPRPYLVYRILAPIMTGPTGLCETDDLAFICEVGGQDTQGDVHPVRDVDGRLLVMILFQPGLQVETDWVLRYRSPKLWNPLRQSGQDTLSWATATLDQRHWPTINELTLKVVFPAGWTRESVVERSNLGVADAERLPTGQTQVTWRHETPGVGVYHWVLQGSPGA
jgi:DNA-binding CsgD family transcriptional regulator